MKLLEVRDLTTTLFAKHLDIQVVDRLSFSLEKGKTLAIVGESGCGKTMAALSLLKLIPKELNSQITGQVFLESEDLLSLSSHDMRKVRGEKIGFIFQNPKRALNPVFSVGDQLREVLHYRSHLDESEIEKQVLESLEKVGIASPKEQLSAYPHQLSGGMIQRVMIAMALLLKPKLLIADEPTTALDVTTQASILKLLRKLQEEEEMAILLITHDMGVVAEMAHEVVVMYATEGIEKSEATTLFKKPLHPYTEELFQSRFIGKQLPSSIPGTVPSPKNLPKGCHFAPRCSKRFSLCDQEVPMFQVDPAEVRCWLYK